MEVFFERAVLSFWSYENPISKNEVYVHFIEVIALRYFLKQNKTA